MIETEEWGLIEYRESCDRQDEYVRAVQQDKRGDTLVTCQHPTVITVGRATQPGHILSSAEQLQALHINVVENNRGGDVTVHNPGQLVGYPIFKLSHYKEDLHWFLREIEECVIRTIAEFGIVGHRMDGLTGVWVDGRRKICAIGIHCSRWVTSHGFALNVENSLSDFQHIVPCGIDDKEVSSMSSELGRRVPLHDVENICKTIFRSKF